MKALIIFQKGIQLSSWGDWSTCSTSCGDGEMIRSRSCLTGCESSTDDLTQTKACNDQQCPGKKLLILKLSLQGKQFQQQLCDTVGKI